MRDLFCNEKLSGIVPQLSAKDFEKGSLNDKKVFEECRHILCGLLSGVVRGKRIEVTNKSRAKVLAAVTAAKPLLEGMFDRTPQLKAGIDENRKLYLSLAGLSQLSAKTDLRKRKKVLEEIMDNFMYNPEFEPEETRSADYLRQQENWKRKVGYRPAK